MESEKKEPEKVVSALERFFLDIIGLVIPGAILLVGVWVLFGPINLGDRPSWLPSEGLPTWGLLALSYATGHLVASFADFVLVPVVASIRALRKPRPTSVMVSHDALEEQMATQSRVMRLAERLGQGSQVAATDVRRLRNMALTVMPAQARDTSVRFMHIAMLNGGVASALSILVVCYLAGLVAIGVSDREMPSSSTLLHVGLGIIVTDIVILFFARRYFEFYARAMRMPFDAALAALGESPAATLALPIAEPARGSDSDEPLTHRRRPRVYLAGGHRSGWQDRVSREVAGPVYLNPRAHELESPAAYTAWDLAAVRGCDILFAYFEKDNPSGYGLTLEVGYAAALKKQVILVDERSKEPPDISRFLQIVRHTATVTFDRIEDGLAFLKKTSELEESLHDGSDQAR